MRFGESYARVFCRDCNPFYWGTQLASDSRLQVNRV